MNFLKRALPLALCAFVANFAFADDAKEQIKSLKVLVIGNSFSNNALRYLPEIVKDGGSELICANAYIGGCTLEKHLKLALKHEADPKSPEGMPYKKNGESLSLKDLLLADKWQVATIQQYSAFSFKPETYRPFAKELVDYVKKYAPQAEIVVHETWAYRADNANFFKDGFTAAAMYQGLAKSYYGIAKELGAKDVIPSGDAFQMVYEAQPFEIDKNFDKASGKLPKQENSLHVGWLVNKEGKLSYDHGHANVRGEYLAALVWYETLFHGDATKIKFKPEKISEEDAAFLRGIAHARVSEGKLPAASPFFSAK